MIPLDVYEIMVYWQNDRCVSGNYHLHIPSYSSSVSFYIPDGVKCGAVAEF